jgi:O-antigen/teichoic acid export membrane protein
MALTAPLLVDVAAEGGDATVLAALAASFPLYAVALIPMAVLQREMRFARLARVVAASNAVSAIVALAAGLAGAGVWALVTRQLLWFVLLAILAAVAARPYLPRRADEAGDEHHGPVGDRWFLIFGATLLIALNMDYLVVGGVSGVTQLGLYSLAFMVAFAPLQQFSGEVGRVLFSAAAASGIEASGPRTVHAVRLMGVLLLPLLPAAVVLAPTVLPALLGAEWDGMVTPFQLLVVVGIGQAIVNCVGETLAGVGQIAFRAKVNIVWCIATLVALIVLVELDGIRGAALSHLVVFVPYAAVYATAGARRAGTDARELWRALRPTAAAVACQAIVTGGVVLALAGAGDDLAAVAGGAAGLAVVAVLLARDPAGPARQAVALLRGRA